jgi:hypothetical protein
MLGYFGKLQFFKDQLVEKGGESAVRGVLDKLIFRKQLAGENVVTISKHSTIYSYPL